MKWIVPRSWEGETAVILAGGPSLRGFDAAIFSMLKFGWPGVRVPRVIAINDSWRLAPWADCLYYCDPSWWNDQIVLNRSSVSCQETFIGMMDRARWIKGCQPGELAGVPERVRTLRFTGQQGLETDPAGLRHGSNSGYASINLAYHFGAKRIILLGYDMHVDPRRSHWHDETRHRDFGDVITRSFLPHFPTLVDPLAAAGVEVINCTPGSALKCWPFMELGEALKGATQWQQTHC